MLIILTSFVVFVVGCICLVLYSKYYGYDCLLAIGTSCAMAGVLVSCFSMLVIAPVQFNRDVDYQSTLHERDMLEYRIEHMKEDVVGNEMLYNDIVEFNNDLRSCKKWANNPWTNWFNNKDIASLDYIELE